MEFITDLCFVTGEDQTCPGSPAFTRIWPGVETYNGSVTAVKSSVVEGRVLCATYDKEMKMLLSSIKVDQATGKCPSGKERCSSLT